MNPSLIFVAISLFLWGIGEGMFFNFVPIYLKNQFLLNEQTIGVILGVFGLSMAVTHIPGGHLADRIGRRPMLIGAWLVGLVTTLIMGASLSLPLYLVGLFGYGLTAFVSSPLSSYATAGRGKWSVGTALSLTTATFNMGMVLGPVTGGWIGDHYGMRTVYWVAAGVFVISDVFIFLIKGQPIDHHDPESPPPGLLSNKRFTGFLFVFAFAMFAMYIAQPLTPNFLSGERGLSLSQTGLIFTIGALGNSLLALAFSRVKPRRGFLFTQGLVALFALLMWRGSALPVFMIGYFLLGGFRAARPMALAQVRELVHDSQMGLTYGTMETVSAIIFILTPPLAGFLYERGPVLVYPIAVGLIAASIIVSYVFSPRKEIHA
jgi:DHA1 family multidrug resistance protein-like MFS transporter